MGFQLFPRVCGAWILYIVNRIDTDGLQYCGTVYLLHTLHILCVLTANVPQQALLDPIIIHLSLFHSYYFFPFTLNHCHTQTRALTQTTTLRRLGIIRIIMNNTWVSPLPLAPSAASYWLWHNATHSPLPAAPALPPPLCVCSCWTSTPDAAPTIRPHFPLIKRRSVQAHDHSHHISRAFSYGNRPGLGGGVIIKVKVSSVLFLKLFWKHKYEP